MKQTLMHNSPLEGRRKGSLSRSEIKRDPFCIRNTKA